MSATDCRLILFAKAPVPGRVKTRLIPSMGASAAAALSRQLILHSLSVAVGARIDRVDLWCAPSARRPFFQRCGRRFPVSLFNQAGGDLGSRMAHAFQVTLRGASPVLLMGTDCPSLTPRDLREGAEAMRSGCDAVVGPAEDGGYVLIGLRRYASELFTGISWGTGSVLHQTLDRIRKLGWRWHELSTQWDVDRPEDVKRLKREACLGDPSKNGASLYFRRF
jgi:rSAM/selenodomain-associated transferase 1